MGTLRQVRRDGKGTGRIPTRVHCQLPAAPAQDDGVAESGQRGAG